MSSSNLEAQQDGRAGQPIRIGRYLLHRQIARGGMATIHIARLMGDEGFSRIVAAKRLLPEFAEDSEFVAMFLDEARVASKVHHPNVVPVLDVVTTGEDVILVQEYVRGAPLHYLLRTMLRQGQETQQPQFVPVNVAVSIACQILAGLQAAHDTVDEMGMPLNIVHRDVSPQNIMISVDGSARLLDFGVAKATMSAHTTRENTFKGKLAYCSPEQLRGAATRQSDVYSIGIVMWEMLVGHRMHNTAQSEGELVATIMTGTLPKLTDALAPHREQLGPTRWQQLVQIEAVILQALAIDVRKRFANATEMEQALAATVTAAPPSEIAAWLKTTGKEFVEKNEAAVKAEESSWRRSTPSTPAPILRRGTPTTGVSAQIAARVSAQMEAVTGSGLGETSTANGAQAYAREQRRSNIVLYALGGLVILLGFGIVFAVVSSPESATTAGKTVESPPATSTHAAPLVPPPPPAIAPAPSVPPPSLPALPAVVEKPPPDNDTPIEKTKPPPPPPPPHKVVHTPSPPPPHPTPRTTTPTKAAAAPALQSPPTPPASAPPTVPQNDCNPPYYFDGMKKVFKPQCI